MKIFLHVLSSLNKASNNAINSPLYTEHKSRTFLESALALFLLDCFDPTVKYSNILGNVSMYSLIINFVCSGENILSV